MLLHTHCIHTQQTRSRGSDKPAGLAPEWSKVANSWLAPFVMEIVNSRIVHRSAALAKTKYGEDFKCERWGCVDCCCVDCCCVGCCWVNLFLHIP